MVSRPLAFHRRVSSLLFFHPTEASDCKAEVLTPGKTQSLQVKLQNRSLDFFVTTLVTTTTAGIR